MMVYLLLTMLMSAAEESLVYYLYTCTVRDEVTCKLVAPGAAPRYGFIYPQTPRYLRGLGTRLILSRDVTWDF